MNCSIIDTCHLDLESGLIKRLEVELELDQAASRQQLTDNNACTKQSIDCCLDASVCCQFASYDSGCLFGCLAEKEADCLLLERFSRFLSLSFWPANCPDLMV